MSLRRRFSILVAVCLTPPFILTVFNTARWQLHLESDVRANAIADARLVSSEVTQVIEGGQQLLTILSKYPVIVSNESECSGYFKAVISDIPIYREAAVIDSGGKFHCSTIPIPPDLDVSDRVYFREPLTTGKFTIGRFTQGRVTKSSSIHLSMPYKSPDGATAGVIVLILNPDKLSENLAALPWHPLDRIVLLDRDGTVVLTIPQTNAEDASAIAKAVFPLLTPALSTTIDTHALPNNPQIIAYAPVKAESGSLSILVSVDRNMALADAWDTTLRNLAVGLIIILLAIAGTWVATHFIIIRPIRAVVETARRRERGDIVARFPALNQLSEFGQLSASLSRMSDKVDELLGQKALLLRELQHRVMNSLNLLSSIFELQGRQRQTTSATREQLSRARDRVVAMGTVYRYLYKTDAVDDIEISELLKAICKESESAYEGPTKRTIEVNAEPLLLSGTNAIALALLTHELITNSIKHAYIEGQSGTISVSLKRVEGGFEFRFADSGRGMPADFQIEKSDSLGMKMILATAHQLGGKLEINRLNPGTEFVLKLPPELEQRKRD